MLSTAPGTAYLSEPLNVLHRRGVYSARIERWYTYITRENEADYLPAMSSMLDFRYGLSTELSSLRSPRDLGRMLRDLATFVLGRRQRRRAVVKDPFAVFSVPVLADRLNFDVVITVRHPAGVASSLKRLGWAFDFRDLLDQPLLMRDHLTDYRRDMEEMPAGDIIGQAALLWTMVYACVRRYVAANPALHVVRQEDFATDPLGRFRRLFAALGLVFTPRSRQSILRSSSADNPAEPSKGHVHSVRLDSRSAATTWRSRLTNAEVERVLGIAAEVFAHFYPEPEWS